MCCRFAINETVITWLNQFQPDGQHYIPGDISPTNVAPVLVAGREGPHVTHMTWGFTRQGKQLVINARSETVWEKPLFREDMARHRCVLPGAWFYEWDRQKQRNTFTAADGSILFLAGLFNKVGQFVILTTAADDIMRPVHDRMPVCIQKDKIHDWLFDDNQAAQHVMKQNELLKRIQPIQQCSLWG